MENVVTTKRKLEDIIDVKKYYVSHGTKRIYEKKVIIKRDGEIKMNSTFINATNERAFAVALSIDLNELIMVPGCVDMVKFAKNGRMKDVELAKAIWKKKLPEQIEYIMKWNSESNVWIGMLNKKTVE